MSLTIAEYTQRASNTSAFPQDIGEAYLAMKLCGETGEFSGKLSADAHVDHLVLELGDMLWYTIVLAKRIGVDFADRLSCATFAEMAAEANQARKQFEADDKAYAACMQGPRLAMSNLLMVVFEDVGAVAETVAKSMRDGTCTRSSSGIAFTQPVQDAIADCLEQVFVGILTMADLAGVTIEHVADENLKKVESRRERGKIHGSGDLR